MTIETKERPASLNQALIQGLKAVRKRTNQIYNTISEEAYYARPIPLRHPMVFYDGHVDAFNWNTLYFKMFQEISDIKPFNPEFDQLFARGIDPKDLQLASEQSIHQWPAHEEVQTYKAEVNRRIYDFLETVDFDNPPHPLLKDGEVIHLLIEHEMTHHETLMYLLHQLPHHLKQKPTGLEKVSLDPAPEPSMVEISEGMALLGTSQGEFPFGWDNEFPQHTVTVEGFCIDKYNVTNGQFLEFVEAGGYEQEAFWTPKSLAWRLKENIQHPQFWKKQDGQWVYKGLFENIPLPLSWPVYVTHAEAEAYARFVGKSLPTEAQWHRAAYGNNPNQHYPWGNEAPTNAHGNFDFTTWSPTRIGNYPKGASPEGIYDLIGNGWEWTCTPFDGFDGFEPSKGYPQYSADFFDGEHYVMKGGSPFTDKQLLRRPFRNWFYWYYPYMYATFRCVDN